MIETVALFISVPVSLSAVILWYRHTFTFPLTKQDDAAVEGTVTDLPIDLHVFIASPNAPSGSPASSKIVLYARMAGIPHRIINAMDGGFQKNKKGKVPVMIHGDAVVGDSQLIIRYLENTFDVVKSAEQSVSRFPGSTKFVPFDALTPEQQAISTMVRITLESECYWGGVSNRWLGAVGITENEKNWDTTVAAYFGDIPALLRGILVPMIRANLARDAWSYGLARHSPKDQLFLCQRAWKAISTTLGNKPYLLGDFPSECDCIAFGMLDGLVSEKDTWTSPLCDYVIAECPNLVKYTQRIKSIYFADFTPGDKLPKAITDFQPVSKKGK